MEIRFGHSAKEVSRMTTEELRKAFLFENLVEDNKICYTYSHYDRAIIGGAKPVKQSITLKNHPELRAEFFLERREIGIINVGGKGLVSTNGIQYDMDKLSCLYLGMGTKDVVFKSIDPNDPAVFFMMSTPAHKTYPNKMMKKEKAMPVTLGDIATSNKRTIYKYIHLDGIASCQLVMGLTVLDPGSVWNSIPPHTHTRRMEAYFYFDVDKAQRVFHFMGEPQETRHLIMKNNEAVVSPPWSIHSGCGTSNYSFIWAMAGENQVFSDMDVVTVSEIK